MNPPRADKGSQATQGDAAKIAASLTAYVLFRPVQDEDQIVWRRVTPTAIQAHGAHDAIRRWATQQDDEAFAGGQVMAVPDRSLTIVDVKVETKRQLTLGAPAS